MMSETSLFVSRSGVLLFHSDLFSFRYTPNRTSTTLLIPSDLMTFALTDVLSFHAISTCLRAIPTSKIPLPVPSAIPAAGLSLLTIKPAHTLRPAPISSPEPSPNKPTRPLPSTSRTDNTPIRYRYARTQWQQSSRQLEAKLVISSHEDCKTTS